MPAGPPPMTIVSKMFHSSIVPQKTRDAWHLLLLIILVNFISHQQTAIFCIETAETRRRDDFDIRLREGF